MASAGGHGSTDTSSRTVSEYEQLVLNLMFVDGDSLSSYWNDASLLHTKEPSLPKPLTTLHCDELQKKALDMFKVLLFDFMLMLSHTEQVATVMVGHITATTIKFLHGPTGT